MIACGDKRAVWRDDGAHLLYELRSPLRRAGLVDLAQKEDSQFSVFAPHRDYCTFTIDRHRTDRTGYLIKRVIVRAVVNTAYLQFPVDSGRNFFPVE
jgi:hypothetical protein